MAVGRGQALESFKMGLEKIQRALVGRSPSCEPVEVKTSFKHSKGKRHGACKKGPRNLPLTVCCQNRNGCPQNHIERLPPEILLKILSYLDASSLFCVGYVNKQFHQLANNNSMWYRMYSWEFARVLRWKPRGASEAPEEADAVSEQEKPEGYWRRLCIQRMSGHCADKWRRRLQDISPYTGLPSQTVQVLRSLCVKWEITVTYRRGRESTFEQSHTHFSDSSVIVCWNNKRWPFLHQISTLQLHGVTQAPSGCPAAYKRPGWRSLIAKLDRDSIQDVGKIIGSDKLVKLLYLPPGFIIGIWRGQGAIAFVMVSVHFHKIVERSVLGSLFCPYVLPEDTPLFDEEDPEYGLHGYALHILLHNTVTSIMSGHFSRLYCRKGQIRKGFIQLNAIYRNDRSRHTPISGEISLPWQAESLNGNVQNCCMLSLTILDEAQQPFWCISTPVAVVMSGQEPSRQDYDGVDFYVKHQEPEGKVKINLVWLQEQRQFFLVSLAVYISVAKVKKHFGRTY